jgi:hypothetical protein
MGSLPLLPTAFSDHLPHNYFLGLEDLVGRLAALAEASSAPPAAS